MFFQATPNLPARARRARPPKHLEGLVPLDWDSMKVEAQVTDQQNPDRLYLAKADVVLVDPPVSLSQNQMYRSKRDVDVRDVSCSDMSGMFWFEGRFTKTQFTTSSRGPEVIEDSPLSHPSFSTKPGHGRGTGSGLGFNMKPSRSGPPR